MSALHKLLVTSSPDSSAAKLYAWRSADLQEELIIEQWTEACKLAQTQMSKTAAI